MNEMYIYGIYFALLVLSSVASKVRNLSRINILLILICLGCLVFVAYKLSNKYPQIRNNYNYITGAAPVQIAGSAKKLNITFDDIVGLENIKTHVKDVTNEIKVDLMRLKKTGTATGTSSGKTSGHHMLFRGNPGTGKTNVARLLGRMLFEIGYLKTPNFVEVQRSDLVAEYVGQTCNKTKKIINQAMGGVLFIDEAYRLCPGGNKNSLSSLDFGYEAIDEIMAHMNDYNIVIIFAGYPQEMKTFEDSNPGLFRRIRHKFDFPDYSNEDLAKIFINQVKKKGFEIEKNYGPLEIIIKNLIKNYVPENTIKKMNGGIAEHLFELSKIELNTKILSENRNNLNMFYIDDIQNAISKI